MRRAGPETQAPALRRVHSQGASGTRPASYRSRSQGARSPSRRREGSARRRSGRAPETGEQRQLWCLAISAKRYTLFARDRHGEPALLRKGVNNKKNRYSEHGLGHLLNPTDPESDDRRWIAQAWLNIVRRSLGLATEPFGFEKRVTVGRITVSSPQVTKPLQALNAGKPYTQQIKPFNFILSCHVQPLGHPVGIDPEKFHLISAYETDPRQWEKMQWMDQYSKTGKRYRISASVPHGSRTMARVKSYGDVLREYEFHPEAKCADASGAPCTKQSVGLLSRRHVAIDAISYIGKESNRFGRGRGAKPPRSRRRLYRVSRSAARRVGDEDSAEAQSHAVARAHGEDRIAAIDAPGDTDGAEATEAPLEVLARLPARAMP